MLRLLSFIGVCILVSLEFSTIMLVKGVRLDDSNSSEYAVLIDAGSAGSRVHVFAWSPMQALDSLKEVCVKKVHPGRLWWCNLNFPFFIIVMQLFQPFTTRRIN